MAFLLKEPSGYQTKPSRGFSMRCCSAYLKISPHLSGTELPEVKL